MNVKGLVGIGIALSAALVCEAAMARVSVGINLGVPVAPVYAAPVYVQPAPVYMAPPPPPPVVYQPYQTYQPAPVMVAPAPAIVVGWHGDRYWDGYRYWGRRDWYARHGGYYGYRHW
ncbi:signal peptide protein [Caballeronia fortuita]|uniref:Signal peptide protein n=1 Tax=Caballeronia fortuita TaxID=1777138 RepID=A0A158E7R9_9BURK|nr:hypothetical protein [Caballeronia fortuita]SAL02941.1 signal peptide protein [Caballeronia fortuita]